MARPAEARPAVLSRTTLEAFAELLAFRHYLNSFAVAFTAVPAQIPGL